MGIYTTLNSGIITKVSEAFEQRNFVSIEVMSSDP
jgi:hypothetical protein